MIIDTKLPQFLPAINQLNSLTKEHLFTDNFLMDRENELSMYYSPHNEYVNAEAKIIIVGITPGWNQMKTAFQQAIESLEQGDSLEMVLKKAKLTASFSGTMRNNLTSMLDQIGLAKAMQIPSTANLFSSHRAELHTTSVIKYPVFYEGKNYTGHKPAIDRSQMLRRYAYEIFPSEISNMKNPSLIIPLGKIVEHVVHQLEEIYSQHTYLYGFPHPSGANGHREKQFQKNELALKKIIEDWKNRYVNKG